VFMHIEYCRHWRVFMQTANTHECSCI